MRKVLITIGLVLSLTFLSASIVMAKHGESKGRGHGLMRRGGPEGGGHSQAGMVLRLKEKLELTDEQVTKLEAIEEKIKAANDAVKAKRQLLSEAVKTGAPESSIRAAATEVGNAIGDRAVLRVSCKNEIAAILTDTQKATLDELKQKCDKKKEQRQDGDLRGERNPKEMFDRIDSDSDGVISFEEFQNHSGQMRSRMRRHDRHGGGRRWE